MSECTPDTGHLANSDHRWQECPTYDTPDAKTPDIWALLEESAPDGCDAVQDLYSWSLNYDAGKGPFTRFLDLIGYSEEHFGEVLCTSLPSETLGYLELSKLADALSEYADHPHDVSEYVDTLMDAESES